MRGITNMNIFQFEVKRLFKSSLIWSLVCGAIIVLFMSFYPSMKDSGIQELVETKLGAFPEGFREVFGLNEMVDFTDIIQYMAYVIQYIAMAASIYGAILGVNALLEEEIDGTIEFLYAQPVSRSQIVAYKILSRVFLLLIYICITGLIAMLISILFKNEGIDTLKMLMDIKDIFIGMSFVSYIFFAVGLLLSTILKTTVNSTATSIGVFFITYVIGVLSKIRDGLEPLRYFSPFDYAMPMDLVKRGWDVKHIILGSSIIIISIIGTFVIYNRKDMKI